MPVEISTAEEFQEIENDLTADYLQTNPIDFSDTVNWNSGAGLLPIGIGTGFTGTYDGGFHACSDPFISRPALNFCGLFSEVSGVGQVRNMIVEDAGIEGDQSVGIIAGRGNGVGDHFLRCFTSGEVTSNSRRCGGIAGSSFQNNEPGSVFRECFSLASVNSLANNQQAGIVGWTRNGRLFDCLFGGVVIGNSTEMGGIIGHWDRPDQLIQNCFSFGTMPDRNDCGVSNNGASTDHVVDCFWDAEIGPDTSAGGGTALTTAEAKDIATYTAAGWDIVEGIDSEHVWGIDPEINDGYPFLQVFQEPVAGDAETVEADIDLPPPEVAASATVARTVSAGLSLPLLTLAGDFAVERSASVELTLPRPILSGSTAAIRQVGAGLTVPPPALSAEAEAETARTAAAAMSVPSPELSAAADAGRTARANLQITVPALSAVGEIVREAAASITLPNPSMEASATIARTASGELVLVVPVLSAQAHGEDLVVSATLTAPVPVLESETMVARTVDAGLSLHIPVLEGEAHRVVSVGAALVLPMPGVEAQVALHRLASAQMTLPQLQVEAQAFEGAVQSVIGLRATVKEIGWTASTKEIGWTAKVTGRSH